MQIIFHKNAALVSTMSIENCKVTTTDMFVNLKILNDLVCILHAGSLPNITYNPCIESLHLEL